MTDNIEKLTPNITATRREFIRTVIDNVYLAVKNAENVDWDQVDDSIDNIVALWPEDK